MMTVSPIRLWVMRAMYLVMAAGLGLTIWPLIVSHGDTVPRMTGVAWALLGTIGLLALLGLRYPLQMIPLLLFELAWKAIWLAAFALPRWLNGTLDEGMRSTIFDTSLGAVLILVIPWRYVWANYVARPGDPWRLRRGEGEAGHAAA
ncbi:hypothetical protein [Sphingosinicella sp.]|uniref:hypothetical protein n=1 Tax=Sphingosinicella sp. TaxID=1917971 RepID=UPI0040378793